MPILRVCSSSFVHFYDELPSCTRQYTQIFASVTVKALYYIDSPLVPASYGLSWTPYWELHYAGRQRSLVDYSGKSMNET